MKLQMLWKKHPSAQEKELAALEQKLSGTLRPVEPDTRFVKSLRLKLVGKPKDKILGLEPHQVQNGLLIAGGVLSFSVMILAGLRMLLAILGALGLIQMKKKIEDPMAFTSTSPR